MLSRGTDAGRAAKVRTAIERLTEAYTWQAIDESDYREQLARLQGELAAVERRADERRIMDAVKIAQDTPTAWDVASPERRKQLVWTVFATIRVGGGRIVSVRPREDMAPILAVCSSGPDRGLTRGIEL